MRHLVKPAISTCVNEGFNCFEELMKNDAWHQNLTENCPVSCSHIEFRSSILKADTLSSDVLEYLAPKFVDFDVRSKILNNFGKASHNTFVQINYDYPMITHITKDARVTFSDILGNIGGTFGIFLGASFMGLYDDAIELFQNFNRRFVVKQNIPVSGSQKGN